MTTLGTASRRVLVVDDDPLVTDSIRRMLQFDGHEVEIVGSAEAALAAFSKQAFDIAMIDYEMPKMKGDQLARALKELAPGQPVVMFSGYAEALSSASIVGENVDLLLAKPFDLEQLRRALARFPRRVG